MRAKLLAWNAWQTLVSFARGCLSFTGCYILDSIHGMSGYARRFVHEVLWCVGAAFHPAFEQILQDALLHGMFIILVLAYVQAK